MKASRSSPAQCRSSKTSTSGLSSAIASKNRRQAPNASARRSPRTSPAPSRPTSGRSCWPIHILSASSRTAVLNGSLQLCLGLVCPVRIQRADMCLDHVRERRERRCVVGERPALTPVDDLRKVLHIVEQLAHQSALADPGNAGNRHEFQPPVLACTLQCGDQCRPVALTVDQRRRMLAAHILSTSRPGLYRLPGRHRARLAAHGLVANLAVHDLVDGEPVRGLVDEDAVLGRGRLKSRGGVDDVSSNRRLARARPCMRVDQRPHPS